MDDTDRKRAVEDLIDERTDELLAFLSDLVAAETVTGHEGPGQDVVIERFESMGLSPDVWTPDADALRDHEAFFETSAYAAVGYEGRPNVAATVEGSGDGPTLTLSGHVDVVPVTDSEWTRDPWRLTREGDRVYGRGSGDMKGGFAAAVLAVEAIRAAGIDLAGDVYLQSTIEEEDGGVGGVLSALERGYVPDGAIIAEPWGVPNLGMASAGVMYFELTIHGRSAHVGMAHEGVNALDKAVEVYGALRDLDRRRKERISYEPAYRLDPGLAGHETNLNVGTIEAADWPAIVPGTVTMGCRIGWPPGETRAEIRAEVRETIDEVVAGDEWLREHPPDLEWFGLQAEPHEVSPDEPLLRTAMANAERVTGREGVFYGGSAGNDTRYYPLYYDVPATSVGPEATDIHGADEHTTVSSLVETSKTIAGTVVDYCGVAE